MVDVFKVFYTTHYNIGALSVLLLLFLIFLLSKKNLRLGVVILAILAVLNVAIYKKTFNRSWTIEIQPEKAEANDGYAHDEVAPETVTFSVKNWSIVDDKGTTHHWCWVEDYWESFANTDIVAAIWGDNAGKKVRKSTESRLDGSAPQGGED
ncbi:MULTISPECIES: hypothetical protein [unclassified Fibrobacter]|uniref:hypothetical protein n=1 Tax=unclassified Fibrobacter TaxID=2634177 RepID=UPI000D6DBAEB|nr:MULTISPECIES: hypothetical protein [unclassified Fibrobacter]PWJ71808.1 hypothetical protein BGX12_10142 [Fibrobacter sp. UWR4]PZW73723.1 hypothetical protein C8E88_100242 [Fibrobacter sp. UWR1]